MPIVGITRQGNARIKTPYGPKVVGIINIRTSEREAAPVDNFFWYDLSHEHLLLKSLKRLHPVKLAPADPKEEMVKLERKPKEDAQPGECPVIPAQSPANAGGIHPSAVIPAQAGHGPLGEIQEETNSGFCDG